jgi:hypothetical protein
MTDVASTLWPKPMKRDTKRDDEDSDDSSSDDDSDDSSSSSSSDVDGEGFHVPSVSAIRRALRARGNDSLRRFVAAGLTAQDAVDSLFNLLWFARVKNLLLHGQKEAGEVKERELVRAFSAPALAPLAECVRECRPALARRAPCVDLYIAPRADSLWEAFAALGASAVSFQAGGSRAVPPEFWVIADACLHGERTRQTAVAAINAYLAAVTAGDPSGASALLCRATVSIEVLRATGARAAPVLAALGRLRDESRTAPALRLSAVIALSILGSGGPDGGEADALLALACDSGGASAETPTSVRCGAIVELGLRHAEDAAVRDALLELLQLSQPPDDDDGELLSARDAGAPAPPSFDVVRAVVRALGVPAIPPESLTEVLLHPEAPAQWARAVALQAFEFWVSTQQFIASEAADAKESRWSRRSGKEKVKVAVDESWSLLHLCAALGQTVVLEELSSRAAAAAMDGAGLGDALLTRTNMTLLHCALTTRQWELSRLLLLSRSEAEGRGFPGLGRLNQREAATQATSKGQLPLSVALRLGAPDDVALALIDATPAASIFPPPAVEKSTTAAEAGYFGNTTRMTREEHASSVLVDALSNQASSNVVSQLIAIAPPHAITISSQDGTLIECALKREAPSDTICTLVDAARDAWLAFLSDNPSLGPR